jgi:hypothetical protein
MKKHVRKIMLMSTLVAGVATVASCAKNETYITYKQPEEAKLVTFGNAPQKLVEDKTLLAKLADENTVYDEDTLTTVVDNKVYYKLESATPLTEIAKSDSGNTTFATKETYYFEVEPVKWRILAEEDNNYVLMSEKIISAGSIYKGDVVANKEAEANSAKSFTQSSAKESQNRILRELVENTKFFDSTKLTSYTITEGYILQNKKTDKFGTYKEENKNVTYCAASKDDVTNTAYGFSSSSDADSNRIALTTDYARAVGAWTAVNDQIKGYGVYATRTLTFNAENNWYSGFTYVVDEQGRVKLDYAANKYLGIRPVIKVAKTNVNA